MNLTEDMKSSFEEFLKKTRRLALLYPDCAWDDDVEPTDFVSQIIPLCSDERLHDPSIIASEEIAWTSFHFDGNEDEAAYPVSSQLLKGGKLCGFQRIG